MQLMLYERIADRVRLRRSRKVQFDDVFVVEDVGEVDALAGVDIGAPDAGGFELLRHLVMRPPLPRPEWWNFPCILMQQRLSCMNNERAISMGKLCLSSKSLGQMRKLAIEKAYLPKAIKKSYRISVNTSGEVIVSKKSKKS